VRPLALLALVLLALAGCVGPLQDTPVLSPEEPRAFDAIVIETRLGRVSAIAFCDQTPQTCAFMRDLIEGGYYDGRAFGRIIPTFVIQEVDRTGGTTDQSGRVAAEFGTSVMFSAGAFGVARDADPESGGSEFFVMDHAVPSLYGNYTAFAQVVEGMDVVRAIAREPALRTGPASSVAASPPGSPVYFGVHDRVPVDPVVMTRVTWTTHILAAGEAARYPLVVGDAWRSDTHRSALEWHRTLGIGRETLFTWYVATRDASATAAAAATDPPALSLADVRIEITGPGGAAIPELDLDEAIGEVRFKWAPPAAGAYTLRLMQGDAELGAQDLVLALDG